MIDKTWASMRGWAQYETCVRDCLHLCELGKLTCDLNELAFIGESNPLYKLKIMSPAVQAHKRSDVTPMSMTCVSV